MAKNQKDESKIIKKLEDSSEKAFEFLDRYSYKNRMKRKYDSFLIKDAPKSFKYERYATLGERMNAQIIDLVAIFLFMYFVTQLFPQNDQDVYKIISECDKDRSDIACIFDALGADRILKSALALFFEILLTGIFFVLFWNKYGATPGKMIMSIKIVDAKNYKKPKKMQNIIRFLGYFVAMLPLGCGFWSMNFSGKKQGWHDKLARTVVISKKKVDPDSEFKAKLKTSLLLLIILITFLFIMRAFDN